MSDTTATRRQADSTLVRRSLSRTLRRDPQLPADLVEALWRDPLDLLAQGQVLQHKPRCVVVRLDHPSGVFLLKRHNWGGPIRTLKKSLRRAPALQCWLDGRLLAEAGLPTPQPRACLERRYGPIGASSFLLTDFIAGETLYRALRYRRLHTRDVESLATQVSAIWQQLDDLHVTHNDLKTENFQIDANGRVWLIDLEKMLRHHRRENIDDRQAIDLKRFFHPRNWRACPAQAEAFRRHLLGSRAASSLASKLQALQHPLVVPRPKENLPEELVTVLIPFRSDADSLESCLHSVVDFADEILIVAPESNSATLALLRQQINADPRMTEARCKFFHDPTTNDVALLNRAVTLAAHPWVFTLFADERVSPDLAKEIQDVLVAGPRVAGLEIMRRRYRTGGVAKSSELNQARLRLFHRNAARFVTNSQGLAIELLQGSRGVLRSHLLAVNDVGMDYRLSNKWKRAA